MVQYEYRCPVHGVVGREETLSPNPDWGCPRYDTRGRPCNHRVLITRLHTNVALVASDPPAA
jgi:hypothetical protein